MNRPIVLAKRMVGRPRAFDREHALGVAADLFWHHGYEGTSTALLASTMGISPPSLYAAFGSKASLYREAVAYYLAHFGKFMSEPLAADCTAREAIEGVLLGAASQFGHPGHAPGCMVSSAELHASPDNAVLIGEMTGLRQAAQHALHARLEVGRKTGELPPQTDTATLAAFYAMVVQGMSVQARDGAKPALLKRLASLAMLAWPVA